MPLPLISQSGSMAQLSTRPCQSFSACYSSLPIPPLASTQCPPPLSANLSTGLHSVSSTPHCQSLLWLPLSVLHPSLPIPPLSVLHPSLPIPPLSVLHPSLPIPPLASTQCPPPLSANPSTGFHSVSSTPLCQALHWLPLSVLHPSLPIPPLAST
ncbi:unnamed protein product, partial [Staurois parvus]